MAFLGFRKWPTPITRPLWPFFAATLITTYGVAKAQEMGVTSPTFAKDPKNPYAPELARKAAQEAH